MEVTVLKKVLAISILMVALALATMATAPAAETNWRFNISADNGAGSSFTSAQIGVKAGAKDPLPSDVAPLSDANDNRWTVAQATVWTVAGIFDNKAWNTDIKSGLMPWDSAYYDATYPPHYHKKPWNLRVAGAGTATGNSLRLRFLTVNAALLPTPQLTKGTETLKAYYYLTMVDNRGVEGSPANGTIWSIPIPTAHSTNAYFTLTLPALNISVEKSEEKLISEGYVMQFYQTPEPSSLMALGAGLMALAGFASRRRGG
jgi:hypothetical protein